MILADLALLSETLTPHYEDAIHVTMDGERIKAKGVVDALTEARVFGLGQPGVGHARRSVSVTAAWMPVAISCRGASSISWCRHDLVGLVDVALGDGTCRVAAAHRGEGQCGAFILADGHRNGAEAFDHGGSDATAPTNARRVKALRMR